MIGQAVHSRLTGFGGVSALIGTRAYPFTVPQGSALPAVTYQVIAEPELASMDGSAGLATPRVRVTAWAISYGAAAALAEQIRLALQGYVGTVAGVEIQSCLRAGRRDRFEPPQDASEIGSFGVEQEFDFAITVAKPVFA